MNKNIKSHLLNPRDDLASGVDELKVLRNIAVLHDHTDEGADARFAVYYVQIKSITQ